MRFLFTLILNLVFICSTYGQVKKEILYVGTYSVRGSEGIYVFQIDRAKKILKPLQIVPSLESPTYLAIHPNSKFLYSVNRGKANVEDNGGSVSSYAIDQKTGRLSGLNHRSSYGDAPCYISIDKTGAHAFVCNYAGGNLVVLPLFQDGLVGIPTDAKKYAGKGVNEKRQAEPHIHSATISADNKFLYVCDLGTDKIYIYQYDAATGKLNVGPIAELNVAPGSGPRHLTFHPNGKYMYLVEEMKSTVCAIEVDKVTGNLTILQDTVRALPETFEGPNSSADIHINSKGNFLYMSNRGHNSISIFAVGLDGTITLVGQQDTGGKAPRNFIIDPKGEFILVANQDSDSILMYKTDAKTGKLTVVGKPIKVPSPVCLKILTLP
ncbi:MAG: lactonase family protein [Chryseolinea sp.]